MRTYTIIITVLFILLCLLGIQAMIEMKKENSLLQTELDGRKKENVRERDSLQTQLAITRDSLNVAFATLRQARIESQEARERSQKTIDNLRKIIFIVHTDSSRTAELKTLYKSYQ